MSTENTPSIPEVKFEDLSDENKAKVNAWRNLGLKIFNIDLKLQAMAQSSISKLINPQSIEQIAEAEVALKTVKAEYNFIIAERKKITTRFDSVVGRLMNPEKSVADAFPAIEQSIIKLKKLDEENKNKAKYKQEELKRVKEQLINLINSKDTEYKQKIADQCSKAYNYALGAGNVTIEGLPNYISKVKNAKNFDAHSFTWDLPEIKTTYIVKDEILAIWGQLLPTIKEGAEYVKNYHSAVDLKFEFYNIAVKNKEAAAKLEAENKAKADADLAEKLAAKQTAAKLDSIATTIDPVVDSGVKELKKKYEVDLDDSKGSAIKIMAAFVVNLTFCEGGVRVQSWNSLTIKQMSTALAWYKNKENSFECGIPFKIVDKL